MKVSCLPVSLFDKIIGGEMSLKSWAENAKSAGLDGIDISLSFIKSHAPSYISGIKKDLKEAGMPVIMATTYPDFTHPDSTQRNREMEYIRRDIALSSELNIQYLRVLAGQAHPGLGHKQGVAAAIKGLKRSAFAARKYSVKLLYEDHAKPGAWEYTDFSYPPEIFLEVYKGVKGTGIGVNFDIGNITAYGEDPLPILKKVIKHVETIHVSDMRESGSFSPVLIGTGVAPIREVFSYLKGEGFDKWLCIEEASFMGMDGIKRAVDYVRETWATA